MMLRLQQVVTLIFWLPFSVLAETAPEVPDYPVDQIAENIYVIHGPLESPNPENQGFMNNPGIVVTSAGVVIMDPGASVQSGEMVLRAVKKISNKPVVAVFNSHIHGDHWLGNQAVRAAYPQAPIYGHPNMIELIDAGEGQNWVELMERLTEGKTRGTQVVGPSKPVSHGEEFRIGDYTFRIHYYGKAHTTSDIMVEIPEASVTFLGDNALNERLPRIDDGDIQGNIQACTNILETNSTVYVPGHGPTGDKTVPERFRSYLEILYASVKRYYDEGISDFEMKPQVAEALKEYADWSGFEAELGKHISLAYLQIEEAEF
jgi:glyoxylase-like metal-dependent hydrolase (beta-lactamase superfamily II)